MPALNTAPAAPIITSTSMRASGAGAAARVWTTKARPSSSTTSAAPTPAITSFEPNRRVSMPAATDPTIEVMPATDTTLPASPRVKPRAVSMVVVQFRMP